MTSRRKRPDMKATRSDRSNRQHYIPALMPILISVGVIAVGYAISPYLSGSQIHTATLILLWSIMAASLNVASFVILLFEMSCITLSAPFKMPSGENIGSTFTCIKLRLPSGLSRIS